MSLPDDTQDRRDNRVIEEKIQQIELSIVEGFTSLKSQHEALSGSIDLVSKNQEKIVKSIYGNGQEGLITKIARIDTKHKYLWAFVSMVGGVHLTILGIWLKASPIIA